MMRYFVSVIRHKMNKGSDRIANNLTTVFSCVPGPIKSWEFSGSKVRELYYLVPGGGALACGIGLIV
jgi:hypothetical protein